ncbi:MAG: hypothetical protein ACRDS9_10815 [Pseudonocardiaceae bacterium]
MLAVVIGVAIALLAVVPVTLLYLPLRLARRRELRRMLSEPVEPMRVEPVAHVAIRWLPYSKLRQISQNPWRDVERGDHAHLATAELRRLGLPAPQGWSQPEPARNCS